MDLVKLLAEVMGTYFMMFAGCGSVVVNLKTGTLTVLGTCIVWGLVVMAMVYSLGHVSGAHFNPAVTIAFATCKRFPWKQVSTFAHEVLFVCIKMNMNQIYRVVKKENQR